MPNNGFANIEPELTCKYKKFEHITVCMYNCQLEMTVVHFGILKNVSTLMMWW